MKGGTQLLQEALLYGFTEQKKTYRERAQDVYGIPCPEPSVEGFLPITILLWFRT